MWKLLFVPAGGTEYVVWSSFYSFMEASHVAHNLWVGHGLYGGTLGDKPHLTRRSS
jgi:hypothetical protein